MSNIHIGQDIYKPPLSSRIRRERNQISILAALSGINSNTITNLAFRELCWLIPVSSENTNVQKIGTTRSWWQWWQSSFSSEVRIKPMLARSRYTMQNCLRATSRLKFHRVFTSELLCATSRACIIAKLNDRVVIRIYTRRIFRSLCAMFRGILGAMLHCVSHCSCSCWLKRVYLQTNMWNSITSGTGH